MKARNITVASMAIALGAVAWVALSNRHSQQGQDSDVLAEQESSAPQAILSPPAIPSWGLGDTNSASRKDESLPPIHASPQSVNWPEYILEFRDQADSEPLFSREAEYQIQRSIDANIDTRKFEVQPIKCRGTSCQILAKAKEPGLGVIEWAPVLSMMLKDLTDTPVVNPNTGKKVGVANLETIIQIPETGIVMVIGFKKP